jgi:serine/threonine protein kinase
LNQSSCDWNSYIGDKINEGAFSEIYSVNNEPDLVAKIWKEQASSSDSQEKFSSLVGAHIPKIVKKVLLTDLRGISRAGVVMEYAGMDLDERMCRKPFSIDEIQGIAKKVLQVLASLHGQGFVHLDIHPKNLTERGMVLDWDSCSQEGFILTGCCPEYTAPEILVGNPCETKSDMWSFGSVLYYLLTGKDAWRGYEARSKARIEDRVCAMRNEATPESRKLFDLVFKMLTADPKERISAEKAFNLLDA